MTTTRRGFLGRLFGSVAVVAVVPVTVPETKTEDSRQPSSDPAGYVTVKINGKEQHYPYFEPHQDPS